MKEENVKDYYCELFTIYSLNIATETKPNVLILILILIHLRVPSVLLQKPISEA